MKLVRLFQLLQEDWCTAPVLENTSAHLRDPTITSLWCVQKAPWVSEFVSLSHKCMHNLLYFYRDLSIRCKDITQHLQILGNLRDLLLQYVLAHIKKDLSKISSTANQRKSMQFFFAILEKNLFCQFFLLN